MCEGCPPDSVYGTVAERVARGAAELDRRRPGWEGMVDLERLFIQSGTSCVAGQVYGHYSDSPFYGDGGRYGMSAANYRDYPALTEAWRDLITARREASPPLITVRREPQEEVEAAPAEAELVAVA